MKIGVKLPNSGPFTNAETIRRVARAAEDLGYDSLWVHDHLHRTPADAEFHFVGGAWEAWDRPVVPNVYEAISTLLYVAGITRRVQLGTSIVVLPLRNPMWLAKECATLDQLSDGRLILGVGAGGGPYIRTELGASGDPGRADHLPEVTEEWIKLIQAVWRDAVVDFEGKHITVRGAHVFPKPRQAHLPIWYGGMGRPAKRRIARLCDGWLPMFLTPEEMRQGRSEIAELAIAEGRDPKTIAIASEHWLAIDRDGDRAFRRSLATRKGMFDYAASLSTAAGPSEAAYNAAVSSRIAASGVDENSLVGDPDYVGDRVSQYREAGVDHLILRLIGHSVDELVESMHLFSEAVIGLRG